jgi:acyl carrier protein
VTVDHIDEVIMDKQKTASKIKTFLAQQFPMTKSVGNDEPLLKTGLIDSLGILDVVTFVETEFGIVVSDEDLLPENFGSIQSLTSFVQQKTNALS